MITLLEAIISSVLMISTVIPSETFHIIANALGLLPLGIVIGIVWVYCPILVSISKKKISFKFGWTEILNRKTI